MQRTNRVALACALVIGVAAVAAAGQRTGATAIPTPDPEATSTPGAAPTATPTPTQTATPMPTPAPMATSSPAQTGAPVRYPPLPDGAENADLSRNLGTFPTAEAAVAAAKAAALPAGAYATALVGGEVLAIDAAGTIYHLAWMGGSGSPQRPPREPGS